MSPSAAIERKERERAEREILILEEADRLLGESGYLGLKMDAIANQIGYAKGTIYQHFASKEDMLLALAAYRKHKYASWFTRAAAFTGRARERMVAIGLADRIFQKMHPLHADTEHLLRQPSIWEKTTDHWRSRLTDAGNGCETATKAIIGDAVIAGDLQVTTAEANDMILGLRSLSLGTHLVASLPGNDDCDHVQHTAPTIRLPLLQHRLLDSYGWAPLSNAWDYDATERRILADCFPVEAQQADFTLP